MVQLVVKTLVVGKLVVKPVVEVDAATDCRVPLTHLRRARALRKQRI